VDIVSTLRHYGGMMRWSDRSTRPWDEVGISRATWYRHGKPTEKPRKPKTVPEIAVRVGASSTRTYQRTMRALNSELGPYVTAGRLSATQADRLLGDPERLRRFLELVAAHQQPNHRS
jgi:hypothetical protein